MRKLILALAALTLTTCGCGMFDRRPSQSYYLPVSPSVPATLPTGP